MLDLDLAQMSQEDAYRQYAYFLPEDIEMAIADENDIPNSSKNKVKK